MGASSGSGLRLRKIKFLLLVILFLRATDRATCQDEDSDPGEAADVPAEATADTEAPPLADDGAGPETDASDGDDGGGESDPNSNANTNKVEKPPQTSGVPPDPGGGVDAKDCPEGTLNGMSGIANVIVPVVPKCILGPNVINLRLRSPFEAMPRINCVLKCIFSEVGIFGPDGRFNMITAIDFLKQIRPPEGAPGGGGGILKRVGGRQLQECLLLVENFQPDEYECRSYAPFFQCIANTVMERTGPMMERCMGRMTSMGMGGSNGPLRGLMGMLSSLSPMGMLGNGGGGGLMSLLGGGSGFGGIMGNILGGGANRNGGDGTASAAGGAPSTGNGLARVLGGEAGGTLAGPLNGVLSGAFRGAVQGGVNGLLAGDQSQGGGPVGTLLGGGLGGLLTGRGLVGRASGTTGTIGAGQMGLNLLTSAMQGQGNLVGAGLSRMMQGVNGMMTRGGDTNGTSGAGGRGLFRVLGGNGLLRRLMLGRPNNGTMGVRRNNQFVSSSRMVGDSETNAVVGQLPTQSDEGGPDQSDEQSSLILVELHSSNTDSIVYQLDRVANLARSLQLLTNNTIKFE